MTVRSVHYTAKHRSCNTIPSNRNPTVFYEFKQESTVTKRQNTEQQKQDPLKDPSQCHAAWHTWLSRTARSRSRKWGTHSNEYFRGSNHRRCLQPELCRRGRIHHTHSWLPDDSEMCGSRLHGFRKIRVGWRETIKTERLCKRFGILIMKNKSLSCDNKQVPAEFSRENCNPIEHRAIIAMKLRSIIWKLIWIYWHLHPARWTWAILDKQKYFCQTLKCHFFSHYWLMSSAFCETWPLVHQ